MRAAILCPGPSLQHYLYARPDYDVTVGVNRAVTVARCQWWSCTDWEPFTWFTPIEGTAPVKFAPEINRRRYLYHVGIPEAEHGKPEHCKGWLLHEEIAYGARPTTCPRKGKWRCFSSLSALVLAEWLGATEIVMYGADMIGGDDFDGPPAYRATRTDYRWQNEINKLSKIAAWLEESGVRFRRNINGKELVT